MILTDFTLSDARKFYSSMENPLDVKGLTTPTSKTLSELTITIIVNWGIISSSEVRPHHPLTSTNSVCVHTVCVYIRAKKLL